MLVKQASSCEDFVITDPKLRSSLVIAAPPCGSPYLRSFSPAEVLGCAALPCEVPWLRSSSLRRSLVAQRSPAKSLGCAALPCEVPWLRSSSLRRLLISQTSLRRLLVSQTSLRITLITQSVSSERTYPPLHWAHDSEC
jgi:hypothetical protein